MALKRSINFSLVVNGPFNHNDHISNPFEFEKVDEPLSPSECIHGTQKDGRCKCQRLWTGLHCQTPIQLLDNGEIVSRKTYPRDILYFALELPLNEEYIKVTSR